MLPWERLPWIVFKKQPQPQKRQHHVAQFASLAQRAPSPGHALAGTDVIQRSGVLWPHDGFQRCVRCLNPGINPGKEAVSTIPCALLPLPPSPLMPGLLESCGLVCCQMSAMGWLHIGRRAGACTDQSPGHAVRPLPSSTPPSSPPRPGLHGFCGLV